MNFNPFKKTPPPDIRDTLFGDLPLSQWPRENTAQAEPWLSFVEARNRIQAGARAEAATILQRILAMQDLESRHYLQAWESLRGLGMQPRPEDAKRLLGVVVEVALPQGLDIVAAYTDFTARYINYTGSAVIWERPDTSLDPAVKWLLDAGQKVVAQIGPWEGSRPPAPTNGSARINLLTPSGLHFGQGGINTLAADPLGGELIAAATKLMQELIAKTNKS